MFLQVNIKPIDLVVTLFHYGDVNFVSGLYNTRRHEIIDRKVSSCAQWSHYSRRKRQQEFGPSNDSFYSIFTPNVEQNLHRESDQNYRVKILSVSVV